LEELEEKAIKAHDAIRKVKKVENTPYPSMCACRERPQENDLIKIQIQRLPAWSDNYTAPSHTTPRCN